MPKSIVSATIAALTLCLCSGQPIAQERVIWRGNGWTVALTSGDRLLGCHAYR